MLDSIDYKNNLYGKKVLENSCGEGNILICIVERYILACKKEGYSKEEISKGLEEDITGYDTDSLMVMKTIDALDAIAKKNKLRDINWGICAKDYLTEKNTKFDYIVGNPPYITYHDLSVEKREMCKKKFASCCNGRFDYCYAFIEKSVLDLSAGGVLAYLIPFSMFRNKYANVVREIVKPYLTNIYDYSGINVFPNRTIAASIIVCRKEDSELVKYNNINEKKEVIISKTKLNDKWIFSDLKTHQYRFGDYFEVSNSIATLKNEVFILDDNAAWSENGGLETDLIFRAASPRSLKSNKTYIILFPYILKNGNITHIDENVFIEKYPCCYKYLLKHKETLKKRSLDKNCKWFEYGRSQAIKNIWKEKLIMPMIISNTVPIYEVDALTIPFAGYFIVEKVNCELELSDAKTILQSVDFLNYINTVGTPTTRSSVRISVKDILNYTFDK